MRCSVRIQCAHPLFCQSFSIVVCIAHRACRYSRHNLRFFAGIWIGLRRTGPPGHDGEPEDRRPAVDDARRVRGLLQAPEGARVCYVLAHGAGAGMSHAFMAAIASVTFEVRVSGVITASVSTVLGNCRSPHSSNVRFGINC